MRVARYLLPAVLGFALSGPASAQLVRGLGTPSGGQSGGPPQPGVRPPPPALPGLASRRAPDPIQAEPGQNLAPTPALFDAINRGDVYAAREAVARGADLDARNVLGLTPLDASVDQDRREIMFFLLSVRTGRASAPPPEEPVSVRAPPAAAPERPGRRAVEHRPGPAAPTEEARTIEPSAPALWAGNGGTPRPESGFLGFDAGRPAGYAGPAAATASAAPVAIPRREPRRERPAAPRDGG